MKLDHLCALVGVLAFGLAGAAPAQTGKQLIDLPAPQQTSYLGQVVAAIARHFQETDGTTVRSNCVTRWYGQDPAAGNTAIFRNATKFPDEDPARIVMAMMEKRCGANKDEGMRLLRERVANKADLLDEATRRAKEQAERDQSSADANLKAVQARAWRLPDGRRIYQTQDGSGWRFEDGSAVPAGLVTTRVPPP
ncbi:hypothetical protein M2352_003695 [Azospirillum fermentarium]|uniref:hypothetical protein n=1 Tax=Azospirillum fermentarium TaxID=1233114 RepID=UPI00222745B2|nr:hypothetical protein [Azospirillum fermentarium]MCW2248061.1 hypothetical protein [Azospirillum fermentarium]